MAVCLTRGAGADRRGEIAKLAPTLRPVDTLSAAMNTMCIANRRRRAEVVVLARRTVNRLTPENEPEVDAATFNDAVQMWSVRRGGFVRGSQPQLDASLKVGVVESGAVIVALMAAQAAQDAVREALAESLKTRVPRVFRRLRRRRPAGDPAVVAATGRASVQFTAAQLRVVNDSVRQCLIGAGYPEPIAEAFADATVAGLATDAEEDQ